MSMEGQQQVGCVAHLLGVIDAPWLPRTKGGGGYAQLMCPLPQGKALSHLYVCFPLGLGAEGSAGCAPWLPAAAMSMYHPMAPRW